MYIRDPDQNIWWLFVYEYEDVTDSEDDSSDTDFASDSDIDWDIDIPDEQFYIIVSDHNVSDEEVPST